MKFSLLAGLLALPFLSVASPHTRPLSGRSLSLATSNAAEFAPPVKPLTKAQRRA